MRRQIIFLLLLTATTISHGMETVEPTASLEMVLCNSNTAKDLTQRLCMDHTRTPRDLKEDIRALYETNTFLHDYFSNEKTMQQIITQCASIYYCGSYRTVTEDLGCHTMTKKLNHFCNIACNKEIQFNEKDLQDPWYFRINLSKFNNQSLLYLLIQSLQFEKADTVIAHAEKIDFGGHINNYLLKLIYEIRQKYKENEHTCNELLRITERLLREKNMPADGTSLPLTALMDASQNNDKPFAYLLLQYDAKPYKRHGDYSFEKNSFEMEKGEPKGWLKRMVKSNNLFKYWSFTNYTSTTLPPKAVQLIMRTIQQLHYHYDIKKNRLFDIAQKRNDIKKQVHKNAFSDFQKNNNLILNEDGTCRLRFTTYTINLKGLLENNGEYNDLLQQARRLLQKGFLPDFRQKNTEKTPLMLAAANQDEQLTQLLLEFSANPCLESCNDSKKQNAFDYAQQSNWFRKRAITSGPGKAISKYLLLKNYISSGYMLPTDVALLIMQMYYKRYYA
jgi:hypothetical protein